MKLKKIIKKLFESYLYKSGYTILSKANYDELVKDQLLGREYAYLLEYAPDQIGKYVHYRQISNSQIGQDLFVLLETNYKQQGYFVEFGATDGVFLSNTYLLEKEFGWNGILAEPGRFWHQSLQQNRVENHVELDCVWSKTGEKLLFNESDKAVLSTIEKFSNNDVHSANRVRGKKYEVNTISLEDLLIKYNAPKYIDYLSIDTEGSEYEILKDFDFQSYTFGVITVEHNSGPIREKIYALLTSNGYLRKHQAHSKYDDWYVHQSKN